MQLHDSLSRFNDHDLPENFVSIAVQIDPKDQQPKHAGILIRYNSVNYLHHYPGGSPPLVEDNFNESGWYIYKILDSFNYNDPSDIASFLQYCRRVCKNSNITYSYIADGSSYDQTGDFASKQGLPEFGTCVGFCLNTLQGGMIDIESTILELSEWDNSKVDVNIDNWAQGKVNDKYPDLNWDLYNAFKKRITPLEYLCSAYFSSFPISKNDITIIAKQVLEEIRLIYKN